VLIAGEDDEMFMTRSLLSIIVRSVSTARDIDAVESVQRRFTERLPTLKNLSYRERQKCLNIFNLELRRLHTDLFWCYKIVFHYVNLDELFVFSPASTLVVINI